MEQKYPHGANIPCTAPHHKFFSSDRENFSSDRDSCDRDTCLQHPPRLHSNPSPFAHHARVLYCRNNTINRPPALQIPHPYPALSVPQPAAPLTNTPSMPRALSPNCPAYAIHTTSNLNTLRLHRSLRLQTGRESWAAGYIMPFLSTAGTTLYTIRDIFQRPIVSSKPRSLLSSSKARCLRATSRLFE